jgi:drug/metabolite transporter (DMT)-like permease
MTTTANALVVMSVCPLLTAVLARIFYATPCRLRTWVAAAAATIGIAWMFSFSLDKHFAGMAVAALIPIAAAINVVLLRRTRRGSTSSGGDARRRDLVRRRPAVRLAFSCVAKRPSSPGVPRLLPARAAVHAARHRQPHPAAPEIALLGLLEVVLGPLWAWLGAGETPAAATLAAAPSCSPRWL